MEENTSPFAARRLLAAVLKTTSSPKHLSSLIVYGVVWQNCIISPIIMHCKNNHP